MRARVALVGLALAASAACAGGPPPEERPAAAVDPDRARRATAALEAAEAQLEAGEHAAAATAADSLYEAWRGDRALRSLAPRALWLEARAREASGDLGAARSSLEELVAAAAPGALRIRAVRRLARLHHETGDAAAALRTLLENPGAVDADARELMRGATLVLELPVLRSLAETFPLGPPGTPVLHVALARTLAYEGRVDSARHVARRVLEAGPEPPEEEIATALAALEGEALTGPVRIGAVLPLTGRFEGVGELLSQGLEIALEEFREREGAPAGADSIVLDIRDDGSAPERSIDLVRRLEAEGALAVIGPIRSESFAAAARARRNPRLLVVSPTATSVVSPAEHAFTLWAAARREADAAREVGRYAAAELGLAAGGILYPGTAAGRAAAEGFREGFSASGGRVVASRAYESSATTFREPVTAVAGAEPDVVYVAADAPRIVLQLAPQLPYYGVVRSVVAGGPTWAEPTVVRRLDRTSSDSRIVGAYVDRLAEGGTAWNRFRDRYERRFDRSLGDNVLPALSHDALRWILEAVSAARIPLPGAVSAAALRTEPIRGASGTFRPDPGTSTVSREPLVRVLREGRLVPPDRNAILSWLERARLRADSLARADSVTAGEAGTPP